MEKEPLYVFDKYDNLLTICEDYTEAPFEEDVNQENVTFKVIIPAHHEDSEHFVGGNQVAFRDLERRFRLFSIRETDDEDGNSTEKVVTCLPAMDELNGKIVEDKRPQDVEVGIAIDDALEGTRFLKGTVAQLGINSTNFYYISSRECLTKIQNTWGGELVDRIEINEETGKIDGRYIDLVVRRGMDRGKRFEIDKDIENIVRTELYYPKTALYGRGSSVPSGDGYSRKLSFKDVEWYVDNGDPVDKPLGQEWIGDPVALEEHGIPQPDGSKEHVYGIFEDNDEADQAKLLIKTWSALQTEKKPKVRYKMSVMTFYGIAGYEHEVAYLGDTGVAINNNAKPAILVESRIIKLKYDLADPTNGQVTIGNFLDLNEDQKRIDWVVDEVTNNSGNWNSDSDGLTEVNDGSFPDTVPPPPSGVLAKGLFKSIIVEWDFNPSSYIAAYEVYASQIDGFLPDSTNLVFRGKTGGTVHQAENDQQWYFRVRAINTHGTTSSLSAQVSAQTIRISEVDFDELTVVDAYIKEILADKITSGTLDGALANIINLNADNIVSGVLKARFVKIGADSSYEPGYDPSKKAEYYIGSNPPTDTTVIWIDNSIPENVIWKVFDVSTQTWKAGPSGPRGPEGLQGIQGPEGDQGIQGPAGTSSYTHIAYATGTSGQNFSTSHFASATYIGMYVDTTSTDSTNHADYNWSLIKGADGEQGIQGPAGTDGQTPYLHIAYANNATGTLNFSTSDSTNKKYIGTYTDYTQNDPTDPTLYSWTLIKGDKGDTGPEGPQGIQGPPGSDGTSQYVYIRYSPNSNGNPMTSVPEANTAYVGLVNTSSSTAPTSYSSYTWSLFKGPEGDQGIQGPAGSDGQTTYTWVKYAEDELGGNMADTPEGKRYIGLAFNKTTQTESTSASAYKWSPLYDNVQVGVRNLLIDSTSIRMISNNGASYPIEEEAFEEHRRLRRTFPEGITSDVLSTYTQMFFDTQEGETYTYSIKVKPEVDVTLNLYNGPNKLCKAGVWTLLTLTKTESAGSTRYMGIYGSGFSPTFTPWIEYKEAKAEKGNIATSWTEAPEDIDAAIGEKASNNDLDNLATIVSDVSAEVNLKAGMGEFQSLEEAFNARVEQDILDKEQLAADLASIDGRMNLVEIIAGDNKLTTEFINTVITESEEGVYISNGANNTGILISNDRISFIDNDTEVAYISNQTMQISHGIFVQSATISDFKFEKIPGTTILGITWVGD
jgi:phage minor structural protein